MIVVRNGASAVDLGHVHAEDSLYFVRRPCSLKEFDAPNRCKSHRDIDGSEYRQHSITIAIASTKLVLYLSSDRDKCVPRLPRRASVRW